MALTNNDYVITDVHGKPKFDHNGNYVISRKVSLKNVLKLIFFLNLGYVAINAKGRWRMICARKWNDRLSKKICQYLGM